jgi:RDD family
VIPLTGWCSYCMDPLPVDSGIGAGEWEPGDCDLGPDHDPEPEVPGGRVIAGPWPDRPVGSRYATWRQRAVATLIDASVFVPALVALSFAGTGVGAVIGVVLLLAAIAFSGWQLWHQGRTGQTIGKSQVGIFLVGEADLAPIGPRRAFLRQLAHAIDATLFGVGYLWPVWDAKHQTFADQLFATVVIAA